VERREGNLGCDDYSIDGCCSNNVAVVNQRRAGFNQRDTLPVRDPARAVRAVPQCNARERELARYGRRELEERMEVYNHPDWYG